MLRKSDAQGKLVSLDIETTGLDEDTDKIWSVGITGENGKGWEKFSDPRPAGPGMDLNKLFVHTSGKFGEEQIARGSLNALSEAIDKGETISEKDLVSEAFQNLKGKAILIQNANFENTRLGKVVEESGENLSQQFRYNTVSTQNSGRKLYVPPEAGNLRDEAELLRKTGGSIDEIVDTYDKMFSEYAKEFSRDDGKSFVIELMDISKGVFAKAAKSGHISTKAYDANVKVDFLSPLLLGDEEKELHTALSDGIQQEKIFYKLLDINEQLDTGTVTEDTLEIFKKFNQRSSSAIKERFKSELDNIVSEMKIKGSTLIIPDTPEASVSIDIEGPDGVHRRTVPRYSAYRRTRDINEAFEHIMTKYSEKMTPEDLRSEANSFFGSQPEDVRNQSAETVERIVSGMGKEKRSFNNANPAPVEEIIEAKPSNFKRNALLITGGLIAASIYSGSVNREERAKNADKVSINDERQTKKVRVDHSILDKYDINRFKKKEEVNNHYIM